MSFDASLAATVQTFQALPSIRPQIDAAADLILAAVRGGHKLLICGNGGSAAEAQHFATELVGRYFKTRRALPALALSADGSLATCIGNDFGFDTVFSRQIEALGQPGDLVVVITSSGNSTNILRALAAARARGLS
jgi:D-sedoheptulose 7-phosphate isomerase